MFLSFCDFIFFTHYNFTMSCCTFTFMFMFSWFVALGSMALPAACSMQPEPEHLDAWMNLEFAKCCLADFLSPFTFMAVPESSAWLCLQFQLAVSACSLNGISNAHTFNVQHPTSNSLQIAGFQGLPESQAGATGMGYRGVWGLGCESNAGNPSGAGHLE
jgi:hypothetical protein